MDVLCFRHKSAVFPLCLAPFQIDERGTDRGDSDQGKQSHLAPKKMVVRIIGPALFAPDHAGDADQHHEASGSAIADVQLCDPLNGYRVDFKQRHLCGQHDDQPHKHDMVQ